MSEIAQALRNGPGRSRAVHLVVENDRNETRYLERDAAGRPLVASAQWNDDAHHALHVLATGESDGYYADYAAQPHADLGRALAEGFVYQGERSAYRGHRRGSPSGRLPPTAFIDFLQTHDQVGNRAFGERIDTLAPPPALAAALACVLLSPAIPLLFMGEEFGAATPFYFFCDFAPPLRDAVSRGRREEFQRFARFRDPAARANLPDPSDASSFERSKLRWEELEREPGRRWHALYRHLLEVRRREIVPRLAGMAHGGIAAADAHVVRVEWTLGDRSRLRMAANLGPTESAPVPVPAGTVIYATAAIEPGARSAFPPWSVIVTREAVGG